MRLGEDLDSSWMLFLKWVFIDFVFLFGLPELRIPWLELSQTLVLSMFAGHALFTYMLMFNIGVSRHFLDSTSLDLALLARP